MKFPYAAKGVSKIFSAEIISLIAAIIGGIAAILGFIAQNLDENTAITLGVVMLILFCFSGVMLLIGAIFNIIGYLQAAKDEEGFKRAVYCTVFSFLFSMGYYLFANQTGFFGWIGTVMNVISQVLSMLVVIYMITGIMNLSVNCNRPDLIDSGTTILKSLIVLYIISYIITFITRYFKETAFSQTVVSFLAAFSIILSVVVYFFQLYFLAKAKKMLKEN